MKKLVLAIIPLVFSVSVNAENVCKRSDLTGKWIVHSTGAYVYANECEVTIMAKGNTLTASCTDITGAKSSMTGTFGLVGGSCQFVGNFQNTLTNLNFYSYIGKTKNVLTGMWGQQSTNGSYYSGAFNGTKQ